MKKKCALVIAGTDPTGGAGIVRDIAALEFFKVKSAIALTAINVQDNYSVQHIELTQPDLLSAQIDCARQAQKIAAIKIGMIGSIENVKLIEQKIQNLTIPIVLDPVIKSSSGYMLSQPNMVNSISQLLLNKISLLTPNLPELSLFVQEKEATTIEQAIIQGKKLMQTTKLNALLIKGGHAASCVEAIDILLTRNNAPRYFKQKFLPQQMRGTGCALSSAITALLAKDYDLTRAVKLAKGYVYKLIKD
ncbi:hydroxymethylpyrimidine/phosphomethylpyrimidine kinase [Bartonella sp. TP]|uniref:hydroxymethylpyrimidine/phosphomethylpyrimidine kinase n=1 Tax=Bartonella sp. TP TaxID=3057550 RepID=UPI0025B20E52|nr:hydroxymethylpyrimidine/phosphomethylpyrimidine kinase [Bartonella sp. TP]WJW80158.1 hydroxymethylpyrimidine/phosphomethylpyrimidine kinase [Bartonella sp. TP]